MSAHNEALSGERKDATRFIKKLTRAGLGAAALVAAATLVVPAVTAEDPRAGCEVTVKAGDTPYKIADRAGTDRHDFTRLNSWTSNTPIDVGDKVFTTDCGDLGTDHTVRELPGN